MQIKIKAWGNSSGIILPKTIKELLDVKTGDTLNAEIIKNKLILTKKTEK